MIHIVLCQPEIPQNTGNIMRTCVGTGVKLHLIEPLGFKIDDAKLRRSAVDYYDKIEYEIHPNFDTFQTTHPGQYFFLSRYGKKNYANVNYQIIEEDIYVVFGSESYGIDRMLLKNKIDDTFRIPTNEHIRSLNLSNAVAIVVYEILRQKGFIGVSEVEPESLKGANYLESYEEKDASGK